MNQYAKRHHQRRNANRAAGTPRRLSELERVKMENRVLADRLALTMHIMTHHEQFIRYETHTEWMKYLEDWCEALLEVEEKPAKGRGWRFDFYRKQQRYNYFISGVRGMLRRQMFELTGVHHGGNTGNATHATGDAEEGLPVRGSGEVDTTGEAA